MTQRRTRRRAVGRHRQCRELLDNVSPSSTTMSDLRSSVPVVSLIVTYFRRTLARSRRRSRPRTSPSAATSTIQDRANDDRSSFLARAISAVRLMPGPRSGSASRGRAQRATSRIAHGDREIALAVTGVAAAVDLDVDVAEFVSPSGRDGDMRTREYRLRTASPIAFEFR